MSRARPSIPEWLSKKTIFVTGATGFMGKVLISKILTSCPDIDKIYLLIRESKGVDPQTRLQLLLQKEPFRVLREKHAERLKKLEVIVGDVNSEGLGLSESDKKRITSEVSVIFHMAANVRFDMSLKMAIKLNTGGTSKILALGKQIDNLEAFIHVSTSYSQCGEKVLEERAYLTQALPETLLAAIDNLNDDVLIAMTPKLLGEQPNTYAFSKSLSEDLVARSGLPVGIVRPSIVVASWKEPTAGWVENMNGPTGLMVGGGKGVIRSMLGNGEFATDVIPCDNAINATIALAWKVAMEKRKEPIIINVTGSKENPLRWGDALDIGKKYVQEYPFSGPLWYPGGGFTTSKIFHAFRILFLHLIPAYFLDTIFMLTGNKPFLVRIQSKVRDGLEMLQYYTKKEWTFINDAMHALQDELCPSDKEIFFMDTKTINWNEYIRNYILGIRKFCLKDDPSTLPRAKRVMMYLHVADVCLNVAFWSLLAWTFYEWIIVPLKTIKTISIN